MRSSFIPLALCGLACAPAAALAQDTSARMAEITAFFAEANVITGPTLVDCTLSSGTETKCFSITVKAEPKAYKPGPWCPNSITDTDANGGIWLKDGEVNNVDGNFVKNLATTYDDATWQLFDKETGKIRVTDTKAKCDAAARPDVDPEYNNYCVQCLPEYMEDDASVTYTIPVEPQRTWRTTPTNRTGAGVAYNGIRLDGPAPVEDILAAHTIAPFDDCGGHVNLHVGYHYHAVTDCLPGAPVTAEAAPATDDAAEIGIAMDGYGIFSHLLKDGSAPADMDKCNGHETEGLGYHYHAGAAGRNEILACLHAEAGCSSETPGQMCDATARPPRP